MKTRICLIESLFCSEAIKKEKPNKVQCDADEIDIFSQEDAPLSVPATSFASCSCVNDLPVCVW